MYRLYSEGREFGIDYVTLEEARTIKRRYQVNFPTIRYYIRKVC